MSGVSNLGKALTVIFICSLVALFSELLYVLWRRRILFRRHRDPPQTFNVEQSPDLLLTSNISSKKDLLYFLCLRTQSRVEPDGSAPPRRSDGSGEDDDVEIIDLYKLREMYGPSRVLFTIKEEDKEDLESEKSTTKSRNLSQSFGDAGASPEFVVAIEEGIEETPFSTPCDSPMYFTPAASPVHHVITGASGDETTL
ncbi:hypothetical protein DCAR_0625638 [Daucus carota subsp. sativus]|uniref:Uncharacterized protein n=1 Tax=Daucus carota subsp. sativus TaxID=79200 RepID=A0A161ZXN9_DAUCS|nr:PREDICTED: uncharacterized protein LOC108226569 [Daucus carota subsp. sativus]WOH06215.1 hypothetical protein DCAR_0625638 [Daucus carota subsp. sativus]